MPHLPPAGFPSLSHLCPVPDVSKRSNIRFRLENAKKEREREKMLFVVWWDELQECLWFEYSWSNELLKLLPETLWAQSQWRSRRGEKERQGALGICYVLLNRCPDNFLHECQLTFTFSTSLPLENMHIHRASFGPKSIWTLKSHKKCLNFIAAWISMLQDLFSSLTLLHHVFSLSAGKQSGMYIQWINFMKLVPVLEK